MSLPFNGRNRVTQEWKGAAHYGLDVVGDDDKKVLCVMAGTVVTSAIVTNKGDRTWEWGNYVRIDGDDGNRYFYCHLASRAVVTGQRIAQGGVIGVMGNTGRSFGAHLHLQIRTKNNVELNVADVIGVANKVGVYNNSTLAPPPVAPPKNTLYDFSVRVSNGDLNAFNALAKEKQVTPIVKEV